MCSTIEAVLTDTDARREAALYTERRLLMSPGRARPRDEPQGPDDPMARFSLSVPALNGFRSLSDPTYKPDERTEEEYEGEVDRYLERLRVALWKRHVHGRWNHAGAALRLTLDNLTERNFALLRVRVNVPGEVRMWPEELTDDLDFAEKLPQRPRRMGERVKVDSFADRLIRGVGVPVLPPSVFGTANVRSPGFTVSDGGSVEIEYDPIHLHPSTPTSLPDVPLLVGGPVGTELAITWSASAESADGLARGSLPIVVVESTLTLDAQPAE